MLQLVKVMNLPTMLALLCSLTLLAMPGSTLAADSAATPVLRQHVTDQTGTLSESERDTLEQTLQAFEARKGSQLLLLIVATTTPEPIERYALRVAEQAKAGRKRVDDGVLLLVAKNDRTMRIEVGYGLEGALNDATCKRIISEIITPRFQQGDFYGGLTQGLQKMMAVVDGEALPAPAASPQGTSSHAPAGLRDYAPVVFILAVAMGSILRAMFGRLPGALITGGVVAGGGWLLSGALAVALGAGLMALLLTLMGGRMAGFMVGGFGSGRSDGGGGGGGGFSGGGGSFGGGGASGRW